MSNSDIREPIQKRSIEKKERIIHAGFDLICKKDIIIPIQPKLQKLLGFQQELYINILEINMTY